MEHIFYHPPILVESDFITLFKAEVLPFIHQDQYGRATRFCPGSFYYIGDILYEMAGSNDVATFFKQHRLRLGTWVDQQFSLLKSNTRPDGFDLVEANNLVKSVILNLTKIVLQIHKRGLVTTRDWDMDRDIFIVRDKPVLTVQIQNFDAGVVDNIYGDFEAMVPWFNQDYARLGRIVTAMFVRHGIEVPHDFLFFIDLLEEDELEDFWNKTRWIPIHAAFMTSQQKVDLYMRCCIDPWLEGQPDEIRNNIGRLIDWYFPDWRSRVPINSSFETPLFHPNLPPPLHASWEQRTRAMQAKAEGMYLPAFLRDNRCHLYEMVIREAQSREEEAREEAQRRGVPQGQGVPRPYGHTTLETLDNWVSSVFPGLASILQIALKMSGVTLMEWLDE